MEWWLILIIAVAAALVLFLAVIIGRACAFKPKPYKAPVLSEPEFDGDKAVKDLQNMIRIRTVSSKNRAEEDEKEFEKFEKYLFEAFPNVAKNAEFTKVNDRALLFKIKGESDKEPSVFMAHYDVVSVVESEWSKEPFAGIIEDDVLWGRGTLDTKGTLNGVMQAAENLLSKGFKPKNDIYLAFGGNEEVNGNGAPAIVEKFKAEGITPALVIDEGGAVVSDVFPGVKQNCALIGIAEKGMTEIKFEVKGAGGHASAPPAHTAVGKLSAACIKVEDHPFKCHISKPAAEMFDTLGRYSSFGLRLVFANMWLFGGLLDKMSKKKGGELNALMRTTVAFTQMSGSKGSNVLPPEASMVANLRLVEGDTVQSVRDRIEKLVGDPDVKVETLHGMNPSRISSTDCAAWDKVRAAVAGTWTDALVSPYLMVACSDSRHYGSISDKVYRFSAMALSKTERGLIHGNDERVPLETIRKTAAFYIRLMEQC